MMTIAIVASKGGVGKSTLATNLATIASQPDHPALLIDLDPQLSATEWGDARQVPYPDVVSIQAKRLPKTLELAGDRPLIVIDTPPHGPDEMLAAIRAADRVLIPTRAAWFDIRAIGTSVDLVQAARADDKTAIVVNAAHPVGSQGDEARETVADYGLAVCPVVLHDRAAFRHSITAALSAGEYEPESKAAHEVTELWRWLSRLTAAPLAAVS